VSIFEARRSYLLVCASQDSRLLVNNTADVVGGAMYLLFDNGAQQTGSCSARSWTSNNVLAWCSQSMQQLSATSFQAEPSAATIEPIGASQACGVGLAGMDLRGTAASVAGDMLAYMQGVKFGWF
jgi:hypothetical protein